MGIKIKMKRCSGKSPARDFKGCCKEVYHYRYGLCQSCFVDWCYQTPEGKAWLKKQEIVQRRKRITAWNQSPKRKELVEEVTNYKSKLQDEINRIVKYLDKGLTCLATKKRPGQMHAGHVYARGGNGQVKFNLHNIHRQSAQSNHFQQDDIKLREGIRREYGYKYMEFITALLRTPDLKYSNIEYGEFTRAARKIANRLEKAGKRFSLLERIEARNKINIELGIYAADLCIFNLKFLHIK